MERGDRKGQVTPWRGMRDRGRGGADMSTRCREELRTFRVPAMWEREGGRVLAGKPGQRGEVLLSQRGWPWVSSEGGFRTAGTRRSLPSWSKGLQRAVGREEAAPRGRWWPWAQIPRTPVRREPPVHSVRCCQALKTDTGRTSRAKTAWLCVDPVRDRGLWVVRSLPRQDRTGAGAQRRSPCQTPSASCPRPGTFSPPDPLGTKHKCYSVSGNRLGENFVFVFCFVVVVV